MSLSSNNLDAFLEVARQRSFSLAAQKLHLTQPALSQRVINLEQEIGSTLFIRESSGIRLTELGQRLLRYCQTKESLESEFLSGLQGKGPRSLQGIIRIGSFSTITRSVLLPVLNDFLQENGQLQVEIRNAELRELPELLVSGAVDFILQTKPFEKQGMENVLLGREENVLIRSVSKTSRDVYLDHDEEDNTTLDFFKLQGKKVPVLKRSYLDEIYTIIDAVKLGWGSAVVPKHLLKDVKGVEVVSGYKSLKVPVYLCYYSQSFYTNLHKELIRVFSSKIQPLS